MFCLYLSSHARSRTPLPEKLPVIEASQSSLNQSSEAGEESDHEENPPPSYHDVILQDTQMDGDGLKYENCSRFSFLTERIHKVLLPTYNCNNGLGEQSVTYIFYG